MNRAIEWFARNTVAANLVMVVIFAGGLLTIFNLRQEVFPELSADIISATVVYPGAAPEEVEEGVVTRIEEAIQGIEGVERIRSTAAESIGTVTVELIPGANAREVLDDVKARIDAIDTFPEEIEQPITQEVILRRQVINVAISGDADEQTLKRIGERVRDDLSAIPGITQVDLAAARPYEVSIEVSENTLRAFDLTFDEVANAVRRSSLDVPGGSVKTGAGEILLRTEGQAYLGEQFERLILRTRPDGSRLYLGDVATVVDGFADTDQFARFDGDPAVIVQVFRVGEQDVLEVAEKVKAYVAAESPQMPEGIALTLWQDDTQVLRSRLDTLVRSGRAGLILVFIVLALFLRLKLAGWVALGIPISFLGGLAMMPTLDVTINLISLFAFIVVLGIVVDDAIVVGENIYRHHEEGKEGPAAAIAGTQQMAVPVIFAILTTIAAFAPLLTVPGNTGKIMKVIPTIVIVVLLFSLFESLFILPAHLSHLYHQRKTKRIERAEKKEANRLRKGWQRFQRGFASWLDRVTRKAYAPGLEAAIRWRYATLALGLAFLLTTAGLVGGGWIRFTFFPPVEADNVVALVTMPQGTPAERTAEALRQLESSALDLQREIEGESGDPVFRHVLASIGEQPYATAQSQGAGGVGTNFSGAHLGEVNIELQPSEQREVTATEITERWRRMAGAVPDAVELTFTSSLFSTGDAINVQLAGPDLDRLRSAADAIKDELGRYAGVFDIRDSFRAGKDEIELSITPEAQALGLSQADLGRQVRQAFFGEEAQRIQRGRDDVKVMVRYPEDERRSLGDLDSLRVRGVGGTAVPLGVAADIEFGQGYAAIQRTDRQRTVSVTADVDIKEANANQILGDLEETVLPRVLADFPGVRYSFEGEQEEQRQTMGGLKRGFGMALLGIYVLLAIPFRSYLQPLIVMSAIPFGLIGAIGGHLLMGMDLTMLSMFGIVALTGVVVNDSLVMVDFINRSYRSGVPLLDSLRQAGIDRFRAIWLTSLTTFFGLLPLILETSMQAQFLIPMAISLAFGVLFATFITLVLVPVLYFILEDAKTLARKVLGRDEGDDEAGGEHIDDLDLDLDLEGTQPAPV